MSATTKKVVLKFEVDGQGQVTDALKGIGTEAKRAGMDMEALGRHAMNTKYGAAPFSMFAPPSANTPGAMNMGLLGRPPLNPLHAMMMSGGGVVAPSAMDLAKLGEASRLATERRTLDEKMRNLGAGVRDQQWDKNRAGADQDHLSTINQVDAARNRAWGQTASGAGRGLAAGMSKAGGYMAAGVAAFQTVGQAAEGYHAEMLAKQMGATRGEQARVAANGLPVIAEGLQVIDALRGRTSALAKVAIDAQRGSIFANADERDRQIVNDFRLRRIDLDARADVLNADRRMARLPSNRRGTVTEERDYHEQLSLLPSRQAVIDSEKDLKAAERGLSDRERMRDELDTRSKKLLQERRDIQGDINTAPGTAEKLDALNRAHQKDQQYVEAQRELKRLTDDIEKTRGDVVALRAQTGQAKLGVTRQELSILEQREARAMSQAERTGRQTPIERAMGRMATEAAVRGGGDVAANMPPDMRAMGERTHPEIWQRLYRDAGAKINKMDVGHAIFGEEIWEGQDDARKKVDAGRNNLIDGVEQVKREGADDAKRTLLAKDILDAYRRESRAEMQAIANEMLRQIMTRLNKGGG